MQGQVIRNIDGADQLLPEVEQRVVVAFDESTAMKLLGDREPKFKLLGYATLKDYEDTALNIRAAVTGIDDKWVVYVEPGLA